MNAATLLDRIARSTVLATVLMCAAPAQFLSGAVTEGAPVKIAVFEFELEDASAGAGITNDRQAEDAHLQSVSAEVRRILAQSGRYSLVDVSGADAQAVKEGELRNCNGCDAEIAAALGAEQSLIGVVRRITRTEYVVSYRLTDTKTGAVLAERQSDLQMGANYSWSRGAARLIRDHLLDARADAR